MRTVTYWIRNQMQCRWVKVTTSWAKWQATPHAVLKSACTAGAIGMAGLGGAHLLSLPARPAASPLRPVTATGSAPAPGSGLSGMEDPSGAAGAGAGPEAQGDLAPLGDWSATDPVVPLGHSFKLAPFELAWLPPALPPFQPPAGHLPASPSLRPLPDLPTPAEPPSLMSPAKPVPEPSSLAMLGAALLVAVVAFLRRRPPVTPKPRQRNGTSRLGG